MQSITSVAGMPTAARELSLDAQAWSEIARFAGAEGRQCIARTGVVRTRAGRTICVVVVEDPAEALPPTPLLRQRFRLTRREAEVALLLAHRLTGPEIARQLGVTIHTARRHTERVLLKLGIGDRNAVRTMLRRFARAAARAA